MLHHLASLLFFSVALKTFDESKKNGTQTNTTNNHQIHNQITNPPFHALSLRLLSLFFILFVSLTRHPYSDQYPYPNNEPETSFVASLEHFLSLKSQRFPPLKHHHGEDTVTLVTEDDVAKFDDVVFRIESERVYRDSFYPLNLLIRVYVYEMPRKFTYDLLWLFRNTYRDTSNGSPIHRLIEHHSIDYWLWADLIAPESERLLKNVVKVRLQEEADLFYTPFFTTISFFLLEKQQCKALYRVKP